MLALVLAAFESGIYLVHHVAGSCYNLPTPSCLSVENAYHNLQDKDMVPALLAMKAAMDTILAESFAKNDSFVMALKEAFEHFINQRQNKCVR